MNFLPEINIDRNKVLSDIKVFALDMDGTIYLGNTWIDGARAFLDRIHTSGRDYIFMTNNSSKDPDTYIEKLSLMGLPIEPDQIITSGQACIWYIAENYPGKKAFVLGNDLLKAEFERGGVELDEEDPDIVVVGFDTQLDYDKMCMVCDFVRKGLPYLATHPDLNCPTEGGFIPDAGSIIAFIHASTNRYPDRIIGKPNEDISEYLINRVQEKGHRNIKRKQIAMVGDRLYTDIAAGINAGLTSILVLSGETTIEDAGNSNTIPDLIYRSVKDIQL